MAADGLTREELNHRVQRAGKLAETARSSWFVLLGALAFAAIAIAGVQDRHFFLQGVTTELPIVGVSVPTVAFFIAAPIILLAVYANFHFYLLRLWIALAELPLSVPEEGSDRTIALADALQPWLLVDAAIALKPGSQPSPFSALSGLLSLFLAWWAGPLVLAAFWVRSWAYHDFLLSALVALVLALALGLGFSTYFWGRRCLAQSSRTPDPPRGEILALGVCAAALTVVLAVGTLAATRGGLLGLPGPWQTDLYRADIADRPDDWLPRRQAEAAFLAEYGKFKLFDLDSELKQLDPKLVAEAREAFVERRNHFLLSFQASNLSGADLRDADLRYAFLPAVIMEGADLSRAQLYSAQLEGALLRRANLDHAKLSATELSCARLPGATFDDADMPMVRLFRAELSGAHMSRANLSGADLSGANLSDADLGFANLSGADLTGAILTDKTNLEGAIGDSQTKLPPATKAVKLASCYAGLTAKQINSMAGSWRISPEAFRA